MIKWLKTENQHAISYFSNGEKSINLSKEKSFPYGFYEVSWNFEGFYQHHFFDRMKDAKRFVQELRNKLKEDR